MALQKSAYGMETPVLFLSLYKTYEIAGQLCNKGGKN